MPHFLLFLFTFLSVYAATQTIAQTSDFVTAVTAANSDNEGSRVLQITAELTNPTSSTALSKDAELSTTLASSTPAIVLNSALTATVLVIGNGESTTLTVQSMLIQYGAAVASPVPHSLFQVAASGTLILVSVTVDKTAATTVPPAWSATTVIDASAGSVELRGCLFQYIGVKDGVLIAATPAQLKLTTSKTTFQSIMQNTANKPAVFDLTFATATDTLDLSYAEFVDCGHQYTNSLSGAIKVTLQETNGNVGSLTINKDQFKRPSGWTAKGRYAILFYPQTLSLITNAGDAEPKGYNIKSQLTDLTTATSSDADKYYVDLTSSPTYSGPLSRLTSPPFSTIYIDPTNGFTFASYPTCGWSDFPCASLADGHSALTATDKSITLIYNEAYAVSKVQATLTTSATVEGVQSGGLNPTVSVTELLSNPLIVVQPASTAADDTETTVTIKQLSFSLTDIALAHPLFKLTNEKASSTGSRTNNDPTAILNLDTITFTKTDSANKPTSSLIETVSGTLHLTHVTAQTITSAAPLITSAGSLIVDGGCTFTQIINDNADSNKNGGVFCVSVPTSGTCSISGVSFTSCTTTGDGGAVYISTHASATSLAIGGSSTSFSSCSATGKGGALYIDNTNAVPVTFSLMTFSTRPGTGGAGKFFYYNDASTPAHDFTTEAQLFYLSTGSPIVAGDFVQHTDSDADLFTTSGTYGTYTIESTPTDLSSLSAAFTAINAAGDVDCSVDITADLPPQASVTVSHTATINGGSKNLYCIAQSSSLFEVSATAADIALTVESLIFLLDTHVTSTIDGNVFKLTSESSYVPSLQLTAVTFKPDVDSAQAYLSTSLIDASAGSLTLTGCSFQSITLTSAHPLLTIGNTLELNENEGTKNSFSSIIRTTGSGAVFEITSADTDTIFTLKKATFTSCASSGYGGAVYVNAKCTLIVGEENVADSVTFTSCSSIGGAAVCIEQGSAEFYKIKFLECISTPPALGYSGTVFVTNSASASFFSCTFEDCSSKPADGPARGSAICVSQTTSLTIVSCTFIRCTSEAISTRTASGGALYIDSSSVVTISKSTFDNCAASGSSAMGGAIYFSNKCRFVIEDCSFTDCSVSSAVSASGGAIYITTPTLPSSITRTTFESCKAVGTSSEATCYARGGAVYLYINYPDSSPMRLFMGVHFKGNAVTKVGSATDTGSDLFYLYKPTDGLDETDLNPFLYGTFSETTGTGQIVLQKQGTTVENIITDWYPTIHYVSSSGDNTKDCTASDADHLCKSLSTAATGLTTQGIVMVMEGTLSDTDVALTLTTAIVLAVTGKDVTNSILSITSNTNSGDGLIQVEPESTNTVDLSVSYLTMCVDSQQDALVTVPLFSVVSGSGTATLSLAKVTVKGNLDNNAAEIAISVPVIQASAGQLELRGVTFTNIALANKPLLDINPSVTGFVMESLGGTLNSFTSITRTSGNGAVIEIKSAESNPTLCIQASTFDTCLTPAGSGGAVYIAADLKLVVGDEAGTTTTSFTSCSAYGGAAVWVEKATADFFNTHFVTCVASPTFAAYAATVYVGASSTVSLTTCSFDRCSTQPANANANGGAIYVVANSVLALDGCTFTQCTAQPTSETRGALGGAIYLASGATLTITKTRFDQCKAVGLDARGGAIYATSNNKVEIEESVFTSCQSQATGATNWATGGACHLSTITATSYILRTTFESCQAISTDATKCSGGAVYLYESFTTTTTIPTFFSNVLFNGNSLTANGAVVTGRGSDLYYLYALKNAPPDFNPDLNPFVHGCASLSTGAGIVAIQKQAGDLATKDDWLPSSRMTYVSSSGDDGNGCTSSNPCKSLNPAITGLTPSGTLFVMDSGSAISDTDVALTLTTAIVLEITGKDVTNSILSITSSTNSGDGLIQVKPESTNTVDLSVSYLTMHVDSKNNALVTIPLFYVLSGTGTAQLTLLGVTVKANSATSFPISAPVISAANGQLKLSGVTFENIALGNTPLLLVNPTKTGFVIEALGTKRNSFSSITRSTGNGAILELAIDDDKTLTIADTYFYNIKTSAEASNGGVLYLTQTGTGSITLSNLEFQACKAGLTSGAGGSLYLSIADTNKLTCESLSFGNIYSTIPQTSLASKGQYVYYSSSAVAGNMYGNLAYTIIGTNTQQSINNIISFAYVDYNSEDVHDMFDTVQVALAPLHDEDDNVDTSSVPYKTGTYTLSTGYEDNINVITIQAQELAYHKHDGNYGYWVGIQIVITPSTTITGYSLTDTDTTGDTQTLPEDKCIYYNLYDFSTATKTTTKYLTLTLSGTSIKYKIDTTNVDLFFNLHVDPTVSEGADCSSSANACNKLETALNKMSGGTTATVTLSAGTNTALQSTISTPQSLTVTGADLVGDAKFSTTACVIESISSIGTGALIYIKPNTEDISVSFEKLCFYLVNTVQNSWTQPLFKVENNEAITATFALRNVLIQGKSQTDLTAATDGNAELITSSIISVTSCEISLQAVAMKDVSLGTAPLITATLSGAPYLRDVEFTRITSTGATAVVSATISSTLTGLTLREITLTQCYASVTADSSTRSNTVTPQSTSRVILVSLEEDAHLDYEQVRTGKITLNYDWVTFTDTILEIATPKTTEQSEDLTSAISQALPSSGVWYPDSADLLFVSTSDGKIQFYPYINTVSVNDGKQCDGAVCASLSAAIARALLYTAPPALRIFVKSDIAAAEENSITFAKSITITGPDDAKPTIPVTQTTDSESGNNASPFILNSVIFDLTRVTLSVDVSSKALSTPVIATTQTSDAIILSNVDVSSTGDQTISASLVSATTGRLVLNTVQFTSITLGAAPLLRIPLAKDAFVMKGTNTFTSISSTTNGAILSEDVSSSSAISINNADFKGCSSNLGVLFFDVKDTATDSSLQIGSNLKFYSDNGGGSWTEITTWSEEVPEHCGIAFTASATNKLVTGTTLNYGSITLTATNEYEFYAIIGTDKAALYHYTTSSSTSPFILAASGGSSQEKCGWKDLPCATIDPLFTLVDDDDDKTIKLIDGTYSTPESVTHAISTGLIITGETEDGCKVTTADDFFTIAVTGKQITIQKMTVEAPTQNFVKNEGSNTVKISEMTFGKSAGITTIASGSLLSSSAGTLTISGVTVKNVTLSDASLISASGVSTLTIDSSSSFDTIIKNSGNGAVLEFTADNGKTLTIEKTSFIKCSSAANGGALALTQQGTGIIVLGDTDKAVSFSGCTTQDTVNGLGAALYLSVAKYDTTATEGAVIKLVSFADGGETITTGSQKGKYMYYISTSANGDHDFSSEYSIFSLASATAAENDLVYKNSAGVISSLYYTATTQNFEVNDGSNTYSLITLADTLAKVNSFTLETVTVELLEDLPDPASSAPTSPITYSFTLQSTASKTLTFTSATTTNVFTIGNPSAETGSLAVGVSGLTLKLTASQSVGASLFKLQKDQNNAKSKLTLTKVTVESTDTATPTQATLAQPLIDASDGQVELVGSTFQYITVTANSLFSISSADTADFTLSQNAADSNKGNTFTSITSTGKGAVLRATLGASSTITLDNAIFKDCSSTAGVLYFTLSSVNEESTLTLEAGVSFVDASDEALPFTTADAGIAAISFSATPYTDITDVNKLGFSTTGLESNKYKYYAEETSGPLAPLYFYLTAHTGDVYLSSDGLETTNCGWEDLPCKTYSTHVTASGGTFHLVKGDFDQTDLVLTADLTIMGSGVDTEKPDSQLVFTKTSATNGNIEVGTTDAQVDLQIQNLIIGLSGVSDNTLDKPIIYIAAHSNPDTPSTVTMNTVQIQKKIDGAADALTGHLIHSAGGELTLTTVTFDTIDVTTNLLNVGLKQNSLSMTGGVQFKTIHRTDTVSSTTGAAVFSIETTAATDWINLGGATFSGCQGATDGLGGAIYIKATTTPTAGQVSFLNSEFSSGTGTGVKGVYVYIECADSSTDFIEAHKDTMNLAYTHVNNEFWYKPQSGSENDLYTFFASTTIFISTTEGETEASCGDDDNHCASIIKALSSTKYATAKTLSLTSGITESSQLSITKHLSVISTARSTTTTVTVGTIASNDPLFLLTGTGAAASFAVTVSYLTFIAQSATCASTLFSLHVDDVKVPTLNLNNIIFANNDAQTETHSAVFISAESGIVNLNTVTFGYITLSTNEVSLIDSSSGKLSIKSSHFDTISVKQAPLLNVNTASGKFSITDTTEFKDIQRDNTGPIVLSLSIEDEQTVDLSKATFEGCHCSTEDTLGYAVQLSITSASGTLGTFNLPSFLDSTYSKTSVALLVSGTLALFKSYFSTLYSDYTYAENTVSKYYASITNPAYEGPLYYLLATADTITLSYEGQTSYCGLDIRPCNTLTSAITATSTFSIDQIVIDASSAALTGNAGSGTVQASLTLSGATADKTIEIDSSIANQLILVDANTPSEQVTFTVSTLTFSINSVTSAAVQAAVFSLASKDLTTNYAELVLSSVTFTGVTTNQVEATSSLILASDGRLTLDGVTFQTIKLTQPLLEINTAQSGLTMKIADNPQLNYFKTIERTSGDGAIAVSTLSSSSQLTLENAEFSDCYSDSGLFYFTVDASAAENAITLGGGLAFKKDSAAYTWTDKKYTFITFYATETDRLTSNTLDLTAKATDYDTSLGKYYAQVSTYPSVELIYYLQPATGTIYIDGATNKGVDFANCGHEKLPCATLAKVPTSGSAQIKAGAYTGVSKTLSNELGITGATHEESTNTVLDVTIKVTQGISFTTGTHKLTLTTLAFDKQDEFTALSAPLIDAKTGEIELNTVTFTSIDMSGTGTSLIDASTGTLRMTGAEFSTITLADAPLLAISSTAAKVIMNAGNKFTSITRTAGNGAVFQVTVGGEGIGLNIQNAEFTDCIGTSSYYAGAVYATITASGGTFTVANSVEFKSNVHSYTGKHESAITLASADASLFGLPDTSGTYTYNTITNDANYANHHGYYYLVLLDDEDSPVYYSTIYDAFTDPTLVSNTAYVGPFAGDLTGCGVETFPCPTVTRASSITGAATVVLLDNTDTYAQGVVAGTFDSDLDIEAETTGEASIDIAPAAQLGAAIITVNCELSNKGLTYYIQCATEDYFKFPLFDVSNKLTLTSVIIRGVTVSGPTTTDGNQYPLTSDSLISASSGELHLVDCTFSHLTLSAFPLLGINSAAGKFTATKSSTGNLFESITRNTGTGAVLFAEPGTSGKLTIAQAQFTDCSSELGAIAISIAANALADAVTLTEVTWYSDISPITDWRSVLAGDCAVGLVTTSADNLAVDGLFNARSIFTDYSEEMTMNKYIVSVPSHDNQPLYYYITGPQVSGTGSVTVRVSAQSSSYDFQFCGTEDINCLTLPKAAAVAASLDAADKTITVTGAFTASATPLTDSVTIAGDGVSTLTPVANLFTIAADVSGKTIKITSFIVPSPSTTNFLNNQGANTVTLDTITFGTQGTPTTCAGVLISSSAGTLNLIDIVVKKVTVTGAPLVSVTGGSVSVEGKSITSTFDTVATTGGVVQATVSGTNTFTVTKTTFTTCSSTSNGGAISLTLSGTGEVTIGATTVQFIDCSCANTATSFTSGYGGSLFISSSVASTVSLHSVSFAGSDARAGAGKYIYYYATAGAANLNQASAYKIEPETVSPLGTGYYMYRNNGAENDGDIDNLAYPSGHGKDYYISASATATACTQDAPCKTLDTVLNLDAYKQASTVDRIHFVYGTDYTSDALKGSITKAVTITGEAEDTDAETLAYPTVKTTGECFNIIDTVASGSYVSIGQFVVNVKAGRFVVSSAKGTVYLAYITFKSSSRAAASIDESLITANAGTLILTDITASKITVTGHALITAAGAATLSVSSSKFTSITSTSGNGAVFAVTVATHPLTLEASFSSCKASTGSGGAVAVTCTGTGAVSLTLTGTSCSAAENGGLLYLTSSGTGAVDITLASITQCSASNGGALYISTTSSASVTLTQPDDQGDDFGNSGYSSPSFSDCVASTNGGGLFFSSTAASQLSMHGVKMESCVATGNGGALYLSLTGTSALLPQFDDVEIGTSHSATLGYSVYVVASKFNDQASYGTWSSLFNDEYGYTVMFSEMRNFFVLQVGTTAYDIADLSVSATVLLQEPTAAQTNCYATINKAVTELSNAGKILLVPGAHSTESEAITLEQQMLIIRGDRTSTTATTLALQGAGTFTVSGSVIVKDLGVTLISKATTTQSVIAGTAFAISEDLILYKTTVTSNDQNTELATSVFSVEGQLNIISSRVENIKLGDSHIIVTDSDASVSIVDSVFNTITSTSNGAALCAESYDYVNIRGTTFETCNAANGGAIYAKIQSGSDFVLGQMERENPLSSLPILKEVETVFTSCTATTNGGCIYFNIASQPYTFTIGDVAFTGTNTAATDGNCMYALTATSDLYSTFTTLEYWNTLTRTVKSFIVSDGTRKTDLYELSIPSPIYLSSADTSTDGAECGVDASTTACNSLNAAVNSYYSMASAIAVVAGSEFAATRNVDIDHSVAISATSGTTPKFTYTVATDDNNNAYHIDVISEDSVITVSFTGLQFIVAGHYSSPDGNKSPLFAVYGASLILASTTITASEGASLGCSVIDATKGTLILSGCTFTSITLATSPLLSVSTSADAFSITTTTKFTSITRSSGSGSVIATSIAEGDSLTIANAEFDTCVCTNGNGGALYLLLDGNAALSLTALSFNKCTAKLTTVAEGRENADESGAAGGAVFIYMAAAPADNGFVIKNIDFAECDATSGAAFFTAAEDDALLEDESVWENVKYVTSDKDEDMAVAVVEDFQGDLEEDNEDDEEGTSSASTPTRISIKLDDSGNPTTKRLSSVATLTDPEVKPDDDDDKSYWWIVFPILAFVIIIVVLVILDYILVCRKEQEGDKATKYEEGGEKSEEMETSKFEEEGESELALVTVPSVSEKPDEEEETTAPSEESKQEEMKAEESTIETTSSTSSTAPSTSEAPATESSTTSFSSTEPSPSESSSSSAEASSSSSASASSSSSSESTPSESSSAPESSSAEASSTSSGTESSSSQPSEPSAQPESSPKEESSSSTGESSETVPQSGEQSVDTKQE